MEGGRRGGGGGEGKKAENRKAKNDYSTVKCIHM